MFYLLQCTEFPQVTRLYTPSQQKRITTSTRLKKKMYKFPSSPLLVTVKREPRRPIYILNIKMEEYTDNHRLNREPYKTTAVKIVNIVAISKPQRKSTEL